VAHVRAWLAVRQRAGTSVRALAEEIGIKKSSVHKYLSANEATFPYGNWPMLKAWYLKDRFRETGGLLDAMDMAIFAAEQFANIPEAERPDVLRDWVRFVAKKHDDASAPYPSWLQKLLDDLDNPRPTVRYPGAEKPKRRRRKPPEEGAAS
jgi:hypothetical protein